MPNLNERREAANGDPPPPNSLRVWVCPAEDCGGRYTAAWADSESDVTCQGNQALTHPVTNMRPVEYLPAADLEQLRKALRQMADAAEEFWQTDANDDALEAALSHARDLLDAK